MLFEDVSSHRNARDRFRHFQDDFCRREFGVTAQPLTQGVFSWQSQHVNFGQFQLTELICDPLEISHSNIDVGSEESQSYFVTFQLSGRSIVSQQGRDSNLDPGDFSIVDSRFPYRIKYDEPVRRLILRLPRNSIYRRLKYCGNPVAMAFSGSSGMNAVFVNFIDTLLKEGNAISRHHFDMLFGRVSDFLIASFETSKSLDSGQTCSSRQDEQLAFIRDYIEANLSDPELSPAIIANAFKMTDRSLHYMFKSTEQTVGSWIWQRRLERIRDDLSNPKLAKRTISEICYAWGFNDSAHFSRKFKERFGISPRSYRNSLSAGKIY